MRNIILSIFIFSSLTSFGQQKSNEYIDSLIQSFGQINDSLLINELNKAAFSRVIKGDEMGALIARRAISLSTKNEYKLGKTDAFNTLGIAFNISGNNDSSLHYFELYLDYSKSLKDSVRIGRALNNLGLYYRHVGDYKSAIKMLMENLRINETIGNKRGTSIANSNIGTAYIALENFPKALEYSKKAYQTRIELKDSNYIAASCNDIGISFKGMEQYDSALTYYKTALDYAKALNNQRQLANIYTNLGNLYILKNQVESGYQMFLKSLDFSQSESSLMITYNNLSEASYLLNKPKEALLYATKAYEFRKDDDGYGNLQFVHLNLANAYSLNGEPDKAREHFIKWGQAKDSVHAKESIKIISEIETKYQTEKKEKENIEQRLLLAESDLKISNQNKLIFGLVGGILLLVFFSLFIIQRKKRIIQKEKDEAIIQEKSRGVKAIINAQEEERKRIAKDLHDGIVQQLVGLKLGLQKFFTDKETVETRKIVKLVDDSANELRDLSHKMMPRSLGLLGLIPALEDMLDKSLGNTDIQYQFEHFGIKNRFKENIEIAIYRIAQELVNNVIKHSKASIVNVQLFKSGSDVLLIIEDNGKGIDLSNHKKGIGLLNISSRLDAISGKVNFEPNPETGTLATIKIPV